MTRHVIGIWMITVHMLVWEALTQTDYNDYLLSTLPTYRVGVEVWYNTSSSTELVSQKCGESYAMIYLTNFIRTEYMFQSKCSDLLNEEANVTQSTVARVRLHHGKSIQLNTHLNISIYNPERFIESLAASPSYGAGVPVGQNLLARRDDILECAQLIEELLTQGPTQLQRTYNNNYSPRTNKSLDLLQLSDTRCQAAIMDPLAFSLPQTGWICRNNYEFVFDENLWKCIPKKDLSTTPMPTPSTEQNRNSRERNRYGSSTSTLPIMDATERFWMIRLKNVSGGLTIREGDDPLPIPFSLTVNRSLLCGDHSPCSVQLRFTVTNSRRASPKCRSTGESIPQMVLAEPSVVHDSNPHHCNLSLDVTGDERELYTFSRTVYLAPLLDMKYDGTQRRKLQFSVTSQVGEKPGPVENNILSIPVYIEDGDRKATCKSVNDPHITTFDGYEYNNFYEGEFVLYEHTSLPYKVHAIYQKCGPGILATCNCAIAIQTGDDVIVIDRCHREKQYVRRIKGTWEDFTKMSVDLFLNDELTLGTSVYEEAEGKKYVIYLPHGTYIKVMVSGPLLNVWIVASPRDLHHTRGLCGTYDVNVNNDLTTPGGDVVPVEFLLHSDRPQPHEFCLDWRVELFGEKSLHLGIPQNLTIQSPIIFCDCTNGNEYCGYAVDVSVCDVLQGTDVTQWLIKRARKPKQYKLVRRSVIDNRIDTYADENIMVDPNFIPPVHTWDSSTWTYSSAQDFCSDYVRDKYRVGQLCAEIPAVNFNQEITTCIEDIQITGNTSWASSARDAMKEQCLEEVQRNGSLSADIASAIKGAICINDCSEHGTCRNGSCVCDENWSSVDCSIFHTTKPYAAEIPVSGLCDIRYMRCNRVIVYGHSFIRNPNLTCHLQECEINEDPYQFKVLEHTTKSKALFIHFNAVECPLPKQKPYLVSVSNDGNPRHASDPLLFLPFDSACYSCNTNSTSCTKRLNSCRINGKCYEENERSPNDTCLICKPFAHELQWTTDSVSHCRSSWWDDFQIPVWFITVAAAIGGSLIGIIFGFLLYKCCCKTNGRKQLSDHEHDSNPEDSETMPFENVLLHRNAETPSLTDDHFVDDAFRPPLVEETYFHANNRFVRNGVIDSATYF